MTTAQTRTRQAQAQTVEPHAGQHTACLRRGRRYLLVGKHGAPDILFENGVIVEVSPEVFAHLAEHALDRITLREGGGKITSQHVRKFALVDAAGKVLPKLHSQTVTIAGQPATEEEDY